MSSDDLKSELVAIKKLLILLVQQSDVQGTTIAKALGISPSRLSQIVSTKEYKQRK